MASLECKEQSILNKGTKSVSLRKTLYLSAFTRPQRGKSRSEFLR